jgi:hypothetical protein
VWRPQFFANFLGGGGGLVPMNTGGGMLGGGGGGRNLAVQVPRVIAVDVTAGRQLNPTPLGLKKHRS